MFQNIAQKPEKMTRKAMKRRLPKTSTMSPSTFAMERAGGASAGRSGSVKKISVESASASEVSDDITST